MCVGAVQFARGDELTVQVEAAPAAQVQAAIAAAKTADGSHYNVQFVNRSSGSARLQRISAQLRLDRPIADGTRYMIGADAQEPDGHMEQLVVGQPAPNDFSNMYVLFRRAAADYLLVGVTSWRTFRCNLSASDGGIRIAGDGEGKLLESGESVDFERIVSLEGSSWQDLLDRYAELIVRENRVAPPPDVTWRGWSTWDFFARGFKREDVDENIRAMEVLGVPMNIVQIDGGWWPRRGDYLAARANLPGGVKAIADHVHARGYRMGLHFDGFRAEMLSTIVKEHPEYFLRTKDGKLLKLSPSSPNSLVVWDYSHPGARDHIRSVMRNAREHWGVDYFKIDFMRNGLTQGESHLPITSVERFRLALRAMREGMGPDAYFLACSANFGPVIGLVDGSRIGQDIHPEYERVRALVRHTSGSYYLHRRTFNADCDYLVLRSQTESNRRDGKRPSLTLAQATMWAHYVALCGNARFESDSVSLLSEEKKERLRTCFDLPFFSRLIPLDLWDHYRSTIDAPNVFLAQAEDGRIVLALFNWDEDPRVFSLAGFTGAAGFRPLAGNAPARFEAGRLVVPLPGVESVLLEYTGAQSFDALRRRLDVSSRPGHPERP